MAYFFGPSCILLFISWLPFRAINDNNSNTIWCPSKCQISLNVLSRRMSLFVPWAEKQHSAGWTVQQDLWFVGISCQCTRIRELIMRLWHYIMPSTPSFCDTKLISYRTMIKMPLMGELPQKSHWNMLTLKSSEKGWLGSRKLNCDPTTNMSVKRVQYNTDLIRQRSHVNPD